MKKILLFLICNISILIGYSQTTFTADIPFLSEYASGDYTIFPRIGGFATLTNLKKPIIIVEGFDYSGNYNGGNIYSILNYSGLAYKLRQNGYDLIILNFKSGGDYIQRNAFLLAKLIQLVNANKVNKAEKLVVVGYSMGGLVARYALTYMEEHSNEPNMDHQTRLYISYDSPQQGANIAISMQGLLTGIRSKMTIYSYLIPDLQAKYDEVSCPAAKQMLIYHISGFDGYEPGSVEILTEHKSFYEEIRNLNDCNGYPKLCRNVALTLGSGSGSFQKKVDGGNMLPGFEALNFSWTYKVDPWFNVGQGGFLSTMVGNWPGMPDDIPINIYEYYTGGVINNYMVLDRTKQQPLDIVPGSYSNVFEQLQDGLSQTISIGEYQSTLYAANACFIPSISALDLATDDYFIDISNTSNLDIITPFESTFHGLTENTSHMAPAQNMDEINFVLNQINDYSNPKCYMLSTTVNLADLIINSSQTAQVKNVGNINVQNYTIKSSANVEFDATTSIRLLQGFKAEAGSKFSSKIVCIPKPCVFSYSNLNLKSANVSYNSTIQNLDNNDFHIHEYKSTNSNINETTFILYPNPSFDGIFYFKNNYSDNILQMKVINSFGATLKTYTDYSSKIDIYEEPSGIYILNIETQNGVETIKLVKQ
jgi:hypothetical protein